LSRSSRFRVLVHITKLQRRSWISLGHHKGSLGCQGPRITSQSDSRLFETYPTREYRWLDCKKYKLKKHWNDFLLEVIIINLLLAKMWKPRIRKQFLNNYMQDEQSPRGFCNLKGSLFYNWFEIQVFKSEVNLLNNDVGSKIWLTT